MSKEISTEELYDRTRNCDYKAEGCFAQDFFPFRVLHDPNLQDDPAYTDEYWHVTIAAMKAGQNGEDLDDTTYRQPGYVVYQTDETIGGIGVADAIQHELGPEAKIGELAKRSDNISDMTYRMAKCAHVCGRIGAGRCAFRQG